MLRKFFSATRWIAKHVVNVVFGAAVAVFLGWAIRKLGILSFKLGENALLGEIDDQIANNLGLNGAIRCGVHLELVRPTCTFATVGICAYHTFRSKGPNWRRKLLGLEPIREVWIYDEGFTASRLSMMRIIARRTKATTVGA